MSRTRLCAVFSILLVLVLAVPAIGGGTVDGVRASAEYAFLLGAQNTPTGFGDNLNELNAVHADVLSDGSVRLIFTGNLEQNGNGLVTFFDSRSGGAIASTLPGGFGVLGSVGGIRTDNWGSDIDGGPKVSSPPGGPSILSPGFNPDLSLELNAGGATGDYYINVIDMTVPNEPLSNRDVFLGSNRFGDPAVTETYMREPNPPGSPFGTVTHAFDASNSAGVLGYDFGNPPGLLGDPLSATTGFEAHFSSLFLNQDPLTEIKLMPFITNGDGSFLSNQFLPGLSGQTNLGGPGDPGGKPLFDARTTPDSDNFYLTIPLPTYTAGHSVWDFGNNWTTGHAPNGINASAVIAGSGGSIKMIDPITLGGLSFRTVINSALSGPAPITLDTHPRFDGSARPARIEVVSANHFIGTPMTWNQDVIATIATNQFLTISSSVTVAPGKGLIKNGGGLIAMNTLRMHTLDIQQGTVRVNIGGTPNQLSKVSKIDTLLIAGGPSAPAAQLNLGNNAGVISNTSVADATLDDVKAYIAAGYNGGAWNGNGIMSTSANAQFALGYATPAQLGIAGTFLGQPIAANDALIRFTRFGDANLSGDVNLDDFNRLASNFGGSAAFWYDGDFNYDGVVNLDDFNLLAGNFGLSASSNGPTPADWSALAAAVPEPGRFVLVALGAAGLPRRSRRRLW